MTFEESNMKKQTRVIWEIAMEKASHRLSLLPEAAYTALVYKTIVNDWATGWRLTELCWGDEDGSGIFQIEYVDGNPGDEDHFSSFVSALHVFSELVEMSTIQLRADLRNEWPRSAQH
jgi:hypothetical protein